MLFEALTDGEWKFITDDSGTWTNVQTMNRVMEIVPKVNSLAKDARVVAVTLDDDIDSISLALAIMYSGRTVFPIFSEIPKPVKDLLMMSVSSDVHITKEALASSDSSASSYGDLWGGVMWTTSGTEGRPSIIEHDYASATAWDRGHAESAGFYNGAEILSHSKIGLAGLNAVFLAAAQKSHVFIYSGGFSEVRSESILNSNPMIRTVLARPRTINKLLDWNPSLFNNRIVFSTGTKFDEKTQRRLFSESRGVMAANGYVASEVGQIALKVAHSPFGNSVGSKSELVDLSIDEYGRVNVRKKIGGSWRWSMGSAPQAMSDGIVLNDYLEIDNETGDIFFLGRGNEKLKFYGYPVWAGHVESVVETNPDIELAVLVGHSDESADQIPVLYYTGSISPSEIKQYLSDKLPWYSIPREYFQVDEIPTTPSGKIDRKVLAVG